MAFEANTDHGTVIPAGEAAIVTANGMTELQLLIPAMEGHENVPDLLLFLTACMVRYQRDPEFVQEQANWMIETKAHLL